MKLDALSIALVRYAAWGDDHCFWQRECIHAVGQSLLPAGRRACTYLLCSRHWNRTRPAKKLNFH
jgi:hypothetical protein